MPGNVPLVPVRGNTGLAIVIYLGYFMTVLRLIVAGMVGSGKSTFVQTIGDLEAVHTEKIATDATAQIKSTTTVAIDFTPVVLSSQQILHVYGVPGQDRFEFMRDIAVNIADICLVLVAAHRPQLFSVTRQFIDSLAARSQADSGEKPTPTIFVGITHIDCPEAEPVAGVMAGLALPEGTISLPVLTLDPRCKTSIMEALAVIFETSP